MSAKHNTHRPGKHEQNLLDQEAFQRFFRESYGQVCAMLMQRFGDLDLAQEALQEAFVVALAKWRNSTERPDNMAAWLFTIARQKAIDALRRDKIGAEKHNTLVAEQQLFAGSSGPPQSRSLAHYDDLPGIEDDQIPDERLRLIFTCCHPALALENRIALTLHTVCGLRTVEIAAAFLTRESTIAQRIVRAKRKIRDAGIPFRIPSSGEAAERLGGVQHVLYLIFNEGYSAHTGDELIRHELCHEAIGLAGILARLLPKIASVHAQIALFCLQASRLPARVDAVGQTRTLEFQDRRQWDRQLIHRGCGALDHALAMGDTSVYAWQAQIAAEHAVAPTYAETNWTRIKSHYQELYAIQPSPVVRLNAAVAIGMADGPRAGLAHLEAERAKMDVALDAYHWYHLSRAELLYRAGDVAAATIAFRRAIAACENTAERAYLIRRLQIVQTAAE